MPKPAFNVLTVVFLVIGLFVGVGIGSLAFPQTIVNTVYQTETETFIRPKLRLPRFL